MERLEDRCLLATFVVNSLLDAVDVLPGDGLARDANGNMTLRAAVMEANALPGADQIILPAGIYQLTLAGAETSTNNAAVGDLDILGDLMIFGAGATTTIIKGGPDRVVQIGPLSGTSYTVEIEGVTLSDGVTNASAGGGGLLSNFAQLALRDVTIIGNRTAGPGFGAPGGGLRVNGGAVSIIGSTIIDNWAAGEGGAIHNEGEVTIIGSTIIHNRAEGRGGAIHSEGQLTLTSSVVAESDASGIGDGIFNSGDLTIRNSTLARNKTGLFNSGGEAFIYNATVVNNLQVGVVSEGFGTVVFKNTIVAGNGPLDIGGMGVSSEGHNIVGSAPPSAFIDGVNGDQVGVDPWFGLGYDSRWRTAPLPPGSPAIDAGDNSNAPLLDQTGYDRIIDGDGDGTATIDIGAFEAAGPMADYGDAPASYDTLVTAHGRRTGWDARLGLLRDGETAAQEPLDGRGDDNSNSPSRDGVVSNTNDEDGVTLSPLTAGSTASATVIVGSKPAFLDAWIDFNGNGSFDSAEQILDSAAVVPGANVLAFAVPEDAVPGPTFARFRLSVHGGLGPVGFAPDGEVEDYRVTITALGPAIVFESLQTGADLALNPDVTFFETGTPSGTALDFTSGAAGTDRFLFRWDFLPAAPRRGLTINVTMDFTPLSGDNDFVFGLLDGANVAGWERSDNSAGSWFKREGVVNTTSIPGFTFVRGSLGAIVPFTLQYQLPNGAGPTGLLVTEGADSWVTSFTAHPLNGDAPLSFFAARQGTNEDYRIHSIHISVEELAPVFIVDTLADESDGNFLAGDFSLREAIELANADPDANTIKFAPALDGGTIVLSQSELPITKSVTIDASNLGAGLTIHADDPTPNFGNGDGSRVFNIDDANDGSLIDVQIIGLTLTGGDPNSDGGAIRSLENLTLTDSAIIDNSSGRYGGGIYSATGDLIVTRSTIDANWAVSGGGIYSADGDLIVTDSTIIDNEARLDGGGICHVFGGNLTVTGSAVTSNSIANSGVIHGGGIFTQGESVTLTNTMIKNNSLGSAENSIVGAMSYGGGIYSTLGNITVIDSTITGNSASGREGYGGGIYNASILTVIRTTIRENHASGLTGGGGGLHINNNTTISSSTISGNRSEETRGGGILINNGLTVIEHSTITANEAPAGRGAGVNTSGATFFGTPFATTEIRSSIIAGNLNGDVDFITSAMGVNPFQSHGHNLIGTGNYEDAFDQASDRTGILDPMLGPLADNGGPTFTHALLAGSPAIDGGNPADVTPTDQRLRARPADGDTVPGAIIDIGAFELDAAGVDLVIEANTPQPLLDSIAWVSGDLLVAGSARASLSLPRLRSVEGDVNISTNPTLTGVDLSALQEVAGNFMISGNAAVAAIDLGAMTRVVGSMIVTNNQLLQQLEAQNLQEVIGNLSIQQAQLHCLELLALASIGGDFQGEAIDCVEAVTADGDTEVTLLTAEASMTAELPAGTFDSPVAFSIERLEPATLPPEMGQDADGGTAVIDPLFAYEFQFDVPTLNMDAMLTFEIDVAALPGGVRTALLDALAAGQVTVAVKNDTPGSVYQAFDICEPGQMPADGCVKITRLDANRQELPAGSMEQPAFVVFEGVTGHFSTFAVVKVSGLVTSGDDVLTLRASTDGTMLEIYNGNPPPPGSEPKFTWPMSANVPLPIDTVAGNDTIVIDLPDEANGPVGGLRINAGSGNNQLIVRGGRVRIDSIAPSGMLDTTIESGAHVSTSQLKQNGLTLAGNARFSLLPNGGTSVVANLTLDPDATLDIGNGALVIDYTGTSPVATVREKILSGRGGTGFGATWNGKGITSSTAAQANSTEPEAWSVGYAENAALPLGAYANFHGVSVDDTAVLIAYTRTGDANLDGVVDDNDVTIVGATYAPGVPQPHWALGDFDYNGFVDDDDVTLLGVFYEPAAVPPAAPLMKDEVRRMKDESVVAARSPDRAAGSTAGLLAFESSENFGPADVRGPETRAQQYALAGLDDEKPDDDDLVELLAESIAAESAGRNSSLKDSHQVMHRKALENLELWSK